MTQADLFIITGLAIITIFDIYLMISPNLTISKRFRRHGRNFVMMPWAWGALGGHFWGPDGIDPMGGSWAASIAILVASGLTVVGINWGLQRVLALPKWWPLLYLVAGIPCGLLMWPQ